MSILKRLGTIIAIVIIVPVEALYAQSVQHIGPSFACPVPDDPLAQLICSNPDLARLDLSFDQTYQAYRQSLPAEAQKALRSEAIEFGKVMRGNCGIAAPGPNKPAAPPESASCVAESYARQRSVWANRLSGAAAEEAARSLEQHLALQRDMQTLGLLASDIEIDGVFGSMTRNAIISFQLAMGLPVTGLLGTTDANILEREVAARSTPNVKRKAVTMPPVVLGGHGLWEHFQSDALAAGIRASASVTEDSCSVELDIQQPENLARTVQERLRETGASVADTDEGQMFKAALLYMQTDLAAKAVHALYGDQLRADRCSFGAAAYTSDIYGRDVRQALFSFAFDRATYERIVWDRFDTANLPKIVLSFSYGDYAQTRLRSLGGDTQPRPATTDPAPVAPVAPLPPAPPSRTERTVVPATAPGNPPSARRLESDFVASMQLSAEAFEAANNDMAKGATRARRAQKICELLRGLDVSDWVGAVETLSSTSEGKGVLVVRIDPHVTIGTTNNSLSDGLAPMHTLITTASPALDEAAALKPKQRVVFSGRFAHSDTDCIFEQSLTLGGSMRDPEFLFQFSSIRPEE